MRKKLTARMRSWTYGFLETAADSLELGEHW